MLQKSSTRYIDRGLTERIKTPNQRVIKSVLPKLCGINKRALKKSQYKGGNSVKPTSGLLYWKHINDFVKGFRISSKSCPLKCRKISKNKQHTTMVNYPTSCCFLKVSYIDLLKAAIDGQPSCSLRDTHGWASILLFRSVSSGSFLLKRGA